jgi:hypothetical protein
MSLINEMWGRLFKTVPSTEDLRLQLKVIEREQTKKRRDMEQKDQEKAERMKAAVAAQKTGKREMLQDIYRELQQMEIDKNYLSKDLRRLSLSKTALNSFLRKVEALEKRKDRKSMESLIVRFNENKDLQRAIDTGDVTDDAFNSLLEDVLHDETAAVAGTRDREDSGFRQFEAALGKMAEADSSGSDGLDLSHIQSEIDRAIKAERTADE